MSAETLRTGQSAGRAIARLAALVAACLWASPAGAQYRFDQWTADNGLPQNSVRDILQTRDGYLWFTTFDGLVRFDGVRFTVFNKGNSPGMAGNRFTWLFEDRFGDLWATLDTGEVVRRHEGRFESYGPGQGLPNAPQPWLADDGQGNAVVTYAQFAVGAAGRITRFTSVRVYLWSENRFRLLEDGFPPTWPPFVTGASLTDTYPYLIDRDFWVQTLDGLTRHTRGGDVLRYDARTGLPGIRPRIIRGKGGPEQIVSRDARGRLWATDLASMRSRLLSQRTPAGLEDVISGYADDEGNYWFSTFSSGLFRARPQTVTPLAEAEGLDALEVYPLLESRDGSIWIGSGSQGVYRLKGGVVTHFDRGGPPGDFGSSLYEDRAGQLWVNGRARFVGGRFVDAPWISALSSPATLAWTMYEDREGAYWIGTDFGVIRYLNGAITRFTTEDGLAGNSVKVIIEDLRGGLWIGSYGGLTHYANGTFTTWTEKDGLPGTTVRALKQDADGTLWIGTYDSGLCRFKDGRFASYTTEAGLYDNGVFQILEDDAGWFWMSSNRGVYRVRKQELEDFAGGTLKTLTCLAYTKTDGMPSSECNGGRWPAGVRTRDGRLLFPTMRGVATIDPTAVRADTQPPPVVIEAMRIDNEAVTADAWEAAVGGGPSSAIRVLPGQTNFDIEYTALSFVNSENLRFRYKLEGADRDWVDAGERRTAYYSYVPPGEYTFRVIAANADGVWNEAGASVRVVVVPPFWQTWWFRTLVALGAVAAVAAAWSYRESRLRRVQAAQQAFARQLIASQESERKRIAGELHDSLGQSLVIIRNWAVLGSSQLEKSAPAREELDEIDAIALRAIGEVREIAYNLGPYHLERLGFENSIRDMTRRVAQASGIAITTELDSPAGALSRECEMNLYRIAQEALNNVVKHSGATEARVALKREAASVRLAVADNGRGFDAHAVASTGRRPGFGLNGMAERVRLLGGTLTVRSAPGQGTTVETLLPETPERAKANGGER